MAQNRQDRERIEKYCSDLGLPHDSVVSVFRDGRKQIGRGRILKVCFKDRRVTERREFLYHATTKLREDLDFASLKFPPFVRNELTELERQRDYDLRNLLRQRREAGETNLIIRNGTIVERRGTNPLHRPANQPGQNRPSGRWGTPN